MGAGSHEVVRGALGHRALEMEASGMMLQIRGWTHRGLYGGMGKEKARAERDERNK